MTHNLRIAIVLSFVAGIVNVTGFLALQRLTTNVTGHFAFFINDVYNLQFVKGFVYFLYIFSFLIGSFLSGFLIEFVSKRKLLNIYVFPTILEALLLSFVATFSDWNCILPNDVVACLMLCAMGIQNAFVTKISNAIVRTTHLTGLFTDLGIELSYLFFPKTHARNKLIPTIKLRLYIIVFFFLGGITAGFSFPYIELHSLLIGSVILLLGLFFDDFIFKMKLAMRRSAHKRNGRDEAISRTA